MSLPPSSTQQATPTAPSESHNHRQIIGDLLAAIQTQKDLTKQLSETLDLFRNKYKMSLDYDNGDGDYGADNGDEEVDLRSYDADLGSGVISAESAADYVGYRSAMENLQVGIERSRGEVERIWAGVGEVRDMDGSRGFVAKEGVRVANWERVILEEGRKAASGKE
ncbi:hypothetical protein VE03_01297 [Pseudogymnoascus sp. 23342-1-I1]|nr:hypothetical protein VE03_01297 [Pseudogymnoascus sp. 23342-1-I1]